MLPIPGIDRNVAHRMINDWSLGRDKRACFEVFPVQRGSRLLPEIADFDALKPQSSQRTFSRKLELHRLLCSDDGVLRHCRIVDGSDPQNVIIDLVDTHKRISVDISNLIPFSESLRNTTLPPLE